MTINQDIAETKTTSRSVSTVGTHSGWVPVDAVTNASFRDAGRA